LAQAVLAQAGCVRASSGAPSLSAPVPVHCCVDVTHRAPQGPLAAPALSHAASSRMLLESASDAEKKIFAWAFTIAICIALAWAYRKDGWSRIGLLYFWLGSLVATQMSVHAILRSLKFPYATFLTFLQFAMLCIPIAPLLGRARPGCSETESGMPFLSWRFVGFFNRRVLPIVLAHTVSIVANNMSLGLIDPGLNVVLGSMTPAITGALAVLFGEHLGLHRWLAVALVVFGGILSIRGGMEAAEKDAIEHPWWGIWLSLAAMVLRSLKNVVIQRSVSGRAPARAARKVAVEEDPVLSPAQLLLLQTPSGAVALFVLAVLDPHGLRAPIEGLRLGAVAFWQSIFGVAADAEVDAHPMLLPMLALNCFCAAALNLCGISVVQRIGATAMQIVGKANVFIVMAASAAYNAETITEYQVAGALVVVVAAYLYKRDFGSSPRGARESSQPLAAPAVGGASTEMAGGPSRDMV